MWFAPRRQPCTCLRISTRPSAHISLQLVERTGFTGAASAAVLARRSLDLTNLQANLQTRDGRTVTDSWALLRPVDNFKQDSKLHFANPVGMFLFSQALCVQVERLNSGSISSGKKHSRVTRDVGGSFIEWWTSEA